MPQTLSLPSPDGRRRVFKGLWEAIWRHRARTLSALALLIMAKVTGVAVPLVLKAIIDRFSQPQQMTQATGAQALLLVPVLLLLGYALLRFAGTLFTELRDLVFARVTQRTVTGFAERSFAHLMALTARFHTQRNTGVLIRDLERGTGGIGFLLGAGLFTIVPTLVEFGAVLVVMAAGYSLWFTLIIMLTFFVYGGFTMLMTNKRELRQRKVNEMDSAANGRMVDSLLNYETVKTYAREAFERERYAAICAQWVEGSVQNQRALSVLHIGQSAVSRLLSAVRSGDPLTTLVTIPGQVVLGQMLQAAARELGAPELAVPRKIIHIAKIPVLGTGKRDYVTIQKLAEELAQAAAGKS